MSGSSSLCPRKTSSNFSLSRTARCRSSTSSSVKASSTSSRRMMSSKPCVPVQWSSFQVQGRMRRQWSCGPRPQQFHQPRQWSCGPSPQLFHQPLDSGCFRSCQNHRPLQRLQRKKGCLMQRRPVGSSSCRGTLERARGAWLRLSTPEGFMSWQRRRPARISFPRSALRDGLTSSNTSSS